MEHDHHSIFRSLRQAGEAIRARRKSLKITQAELAKRSGVVQARISDIETGVISPGIDVYLRLVAALGADIALIDRSIDDGIS